MAKKTKRPINRRGGIIGKARPTGMPVIKQSENIRPPFNGEQMGLPFAFISWIGKRVRSFMGKAPEKNG